MTREANQFGDNFLKVQMHVEYDALQSCIRDCREGIIMGINTGTLDNANNQQLPRIMAEAIVSAVDMRMKFERLDSERRI